MDSQIQPELYSPGGQGSHILLFDQRVQLVPSIKAHARPLGSLSYSIYACSGEKQNSPRVQRIQETPVHPKEQTIIQLHMGQVWLFAGGLRLEGGYIKLHTLQSNKSSPWQSIIDLESQPLSYLDAFGSLGASWCRNDGSVRSNGHPWLTLFPLVSMQISYVDI